MVTKDDITMALYQNIHAAEIEEAKENGTLLSYFGAIATRIMEMTGSVNQPKPMKREESRTVLTDTPIVSPKPMREAIKLETRETVKVSANGRDSVRVRGNL